MAEIISKKTKVRKGIGLKVLLGIIGGVVSGFAVSFVISNRDYLIQKCKELISEVETTESEEKEVEEEADNEESGSEDEKERKGIYSPISPKIRRLGESLDEKLEREIKEIKEGVEKNNRNIDDIKRQNDSILEILNKK